MSRFQTRREEAKFLLASIVEWEDKVLRYARSQVSFAIRDSAFVEGMCHSWMLNYMGEFPELEDEILKFKAKATKMGDDGVYYINHSDNHLGSVPLGSWLNYLEAADK